MGEAQVNPHPLLLLWGHVRFHHDPVHPVSGGSGGHQRRPTLEGRFPTVEDTAMAVNVAYLVNCDLCGRTTVRPDQIVIDADGFQFIHCSTLQERHMPGVWLWTSEQILKLADEA